MTYRSNGRFGTVTLVTLAALCSFSWTTDAAETTKVSAIEMAPKDGGRTIVISTNRTPTFSVFRLTDPFRLLVDISDADVAKGLDFVKYEDAVVRYASTHVFSDEKTKIVRVEIALHRELEYDVRAKGKSIVVKLAAPTAPAGKTERAVGPAQIGRLEKKVGKSELSLVAKLEGTFGDQVQVEEIDSPRRMVIDIANVEVSPKWQKLNVGEHGVRRARVGVRDGGMRVVLDLDPKVETTPKVAVSGDHGELVINVLPQKKLAKAEPAKQKKAEPKETKKSVTIARSEKASLAKEEPAVVAKKVEKEEAKPEKKVAIADLTAVEDVRFEPKDGFLRLTVELSSDAPIMKDPSTSRRVPVLRLKNTALPESLIRTLDTTAIGEEVVRSISSYNEGSDAILAARIGSNTEHRHWRKGNRLMWDFRAKSEAPAGPVTGARVIEYPEAATSGYAARGASEIGEELPTARRRYRGRRISLDLKDADIRNVLRLLADVSKLNIVASDDVKGTVTLKLRNVPWDQALDIILQSKQLDKVRMGNIIRVAPIEVLEKEEQLKLQRKEALEKLEKMSVRLIAVSYATAKDIAPQVKSLLSARGRVQVDERTNVLIVEDVPEVLLKVERLVKTLDTQTPQVLIEARIVEAATSFARELGIQWGGHVNMLPAYGNATGIAFPNSIRMAGGADDDATPTSGVLSADNNFAVNLPAAVGTGAGGGVGFVFGSAGGASVLALRLTAAETEGRTKIISQPKIVTLDNRKATIVSGERIPITVITANGPTTRFINAFLELTVVPHVTSDGGILMQIAAAKNEISQRTDLLGTPGIIAREAKTEMLIQDGDTAVLGGIYRRTATESSAQVPFFDDIPILGWLFKTTNRSDSREELLIFISPRIVNRNEALVRSG